MHVWCHSTWLKWNPSRTLILIYIETSWRLTGLWTKNSHAGFCGLGADHALEQINRSMKVSGGLIGITLNPHARTTFFLISWNRKIGIRCPADGRNGFIFQNRTPWSFWSFTRMPWEQCSESCSNIRGFTNPFTVDSRGLFNLVTKSVMPEKVIGPLQTKWNWKRVIWNFCHKANKEQGWEPLGPNEEAEAYNMG